MFNISRYLDQCSNHVPQLEARSVVLRYLIPVSNLSAYASGARQAAVHKSLPAVVEKQIPTGCNYVDKPCLHTSLGKPHFALPTYRDRWDIRNEHIPGKGDIAV